MRTTALCLTASTLLACLSPLAHAQTATGLSLVKPELLHAFSSGVADFSNNVAYSSDGNFYGFSYTGGRFSRGAFFKVDSLGAVSVLASFGDPLSSARGLRPVGLPVESNGYFYGMTEGGGRFGNGTLFRISTTTYAVETLVDFTGYDGAARGGYPQSGLTLAADGNFYGFCRDGAEDGGLIFRMSPSGRYEVVVILTGRAGAAPGGYFSETPLFADGNRLIGTTSSGGSASAGVIFSLTTSGVYTVLAQFDGKQPPSGAALPERGPLAASPSIPTITGAGPNGPLVKGADGTIYGRYRVPSYSYELIWKLPSGGVPQSFVSLEDYTYYTSGLATFSNGNLAVLSLSVSAFSGNAGLLSITPAGVITPLEDLGTLYTTYGNYYIPNQRNLVGYGSGGLVLASGGKLLKRPDGGPTAAFATTNPDGGTDKGASPLDSLLVAGDGTIFGRTSRGGTNDYGTLYRRDSTGDLSPVLDLTNYATGVFYSERDNYSPLNSAPLVFAPNGDVLFASYSTSNYGAGEIFRITPSGTLGTSIGFDYSGPRFPSGGLIADGLGNFYGHATIANLTTSYDEPVIYRLTSGGSIELVANLASLARQNLNYFAYASTLTLESPTSLIGTLPSGGADYDGLLFRVTAAGQATKLLDFSKTPDKARTPIGPFLKEPSGSFLIASTENHYSIAEEDSGSFNNGILLRLPVSGNPQPVINFTGKSGAAPGTKPNAPLVRDPATGRVYGVTAYGGSSDLGVLYRLESNGSTYTPLYQFRFDSTSDGLGGLPSTGLTLAGNYIYGGTFLGGPSGGGTLFRFPLLPSGSATTSPITVFTSNSATLSGSLTSNGYGGEYWFTLAESGGPTIETDHLPLDGFSGSQSIQVLLDTLKGHRHYTVTLHTKLGFGSDAVTYTGGTQTLDTPNGSPRPADDTIIVTDTTGGTVGEVLVNDLPDPDDDVITIDPAGFTQPTYGTVTLGANNTVIYTPTPDFFDPNIGKGRDSFTYTVKDDQTPALSKTAKVDVLSTISISGDYSGLLLDEELAPSALPAGAEAITADQIAAGFASIALNKTKKFSARFQVGTRTVTVKGTMAEGRGTRVTQPRAGFEGELRPTPGGVEGRITLNGRTLVLRMGQAFEAALGQVRETSDYTMRFDPQTVKDPLNSSGVPAGSGYAIVLERKKSRAKLVGVLPDGTPFSNGTVVGADKQMDFFTTIYKGKIGSVGGQLVLDNSGNIDGAAGTPVQWKKAANPKEKRFSAGFGTKMTAFGGKYAVPSKTSPPFPCAVGDVLSVKFDRGGLFAPAFTFVGFNGKKPVLNPNGLPDPDAKAKVKFDQRTGLVTGTFIPVKKPVAWKALIINRDKTARGFFLGNGDTGSVEITIVP